jgi:hypothetical protein
LLYEKRQGEHGPSETLIKVHLRGRKRFWMVRLLARHPGYEIEHNIFDSRTIDRNERLNDEIKARMYRKLIDYRKEYM